MPNKIKDENVLQEADRIINGERMAAYGDPITNFESAAVGWSVIVNAPISAEQVCLMMAWLKILRENNKHARDNIVDICGYAALAMKVKTGDLKA